MTKAGTALGETGKGGGQPAPVQRQHGGMCGGVQRGGKLHHQGAVTDGQEAGQSWQETAQRDAPRRQPVAQIVRAMATAPGLSP